MTQLIAKIAVLSVAVAISVVVSLHGAEPKAASAAASANVPPVSVGKVAQADWDAYSKWTATLPAEELAWEKMLQKHLGEYYFSVYLKQRLSGGYTLEEPDVWGFVRDDPSLPRVLLIGDSISCGYTPQVRRLLKGKANVHRAPANCYSTREARAYMEDWLAAPAGKRWDVIHFNFGYHDQKGAERYAAGLEKVIERLQKTGAILVWARTVPFKDATAAGDRVKMLNDTADAIMTKHGIKVNDLYATVAGDLDKYISSDNIHFNPTGVKVQAEQVARVLGEILDAQQRAGKGGSAE